MDLQAYLSKKYGAVKHINTKKIKKKKKEKEIPGGAVRIVDDDAQWQKEIKVEAVDGEEYAPVMIEGEDLTRSKRMELLRQRTYLAIGEQGGGWVDVTPAPKIPTPSPTPAADDEQDLTPPRRRSRHDSPDMSPGRRDSPDMSPPRRRARHDSPDMSPPRRQARHDSPDMSPPRKGRRSVSPGSTRGAPGKSPGREAGRRARHDSPDMSPPRRKSNRHDSPDRRGRRGSSPPIKVKQEQDLSPPRRARNSPDLRGKVKVKQEQDLSPPRRRGTGDLSPPRRRQSSPGHASSSRKVKQEDLSPPRRASGLKTGSQLREEILEKQAQDARRFQQLDSSVTGRGAETVYRDKQGRRLAGVEELVKQRQGPPKAAEKPLEWGTGIAQKREMLKRQAELEAERDKPFGRGNDDMDAAFKNRIRWGDPMAHLVRQSDEMLLEDFSKDEKMAESGFNVPQDIPAHSWLKRRLAAAPNRYNIRPGRHWDGIDRSNGFEDKLFTAQNQQKAKLDLAYKWSVQDM